MGLVLLVLLVVVHEFGHFLAARRNGVVVEEFGIGFPPRAIAKKLKSGLILTLNWLPLGGFVKLKGEHDSDTAKGSYGAASLSAKTKIMLAGVGMNLLVAVVLLTIVAWMGMPQLSKDFVCNQFTIKSDEHIASNSKNNNAETVSDVFKGSPAERAGLKDGDQILALAGKNVTCHSVLVSTARANAGNTVNILIKRGTTLENKNITLNTVKAANNNSFIGIGTISGGGGGLQVVRYTWSAPVVAVGTSAQMTALTLKGLGQSLKGLGSLMAGLVTNNRAARQSGQTQATQNVSGPVGIFFIFKDGSNLGVGFILFIVAIISLTLAIINILPIPALDGGRLFMTYLFRAMRRPLPKKTEELINFVGFIVLMVLVVLITIVDLHRRH